ncbi:unnamed protein product [Pylaiella littoralis]
MDRVRPPASWDTRAFVRKPLDTTMRRPPSSTFFVLRSEEQRDHYEEQGMQGRTAAAASPASQYQEPSPRFTIQPPSRSFDGKFTLRQCSPSPLVPEWHASTAVSSSSAFDFSSSSNCGGGGAARDLPCSASDSDASMDAEVASLTSGRRLGNGVAGLLRMANAPCRPLSGEPRIKGAESAVALFTLLSPSTRPAETPSPIEEHHQQQGGSRARPDWGSSNAAARGGDSDAAAGGWGGSGPAAKRQRRCQTHQVTSTPSKV